MPDTEISLENSPGHLFIVDGDVTRLACDAWLLPTDVNTWITDSFAHAVGLPGEGQLYRTGWFEEKPFKAWPEGRDNSEPGLWLGDIGRGPWTDPSFFAERAADFIRHVGPLVAERPAGGRERALLAVNLLGSGDGGSAAKRLSLCQALVPALTDAARETGVDVALVTWGREPYSAAQRARMDLLRSRGAEARATAWDLGSRVEMLDARARRLAEAVRNGSLVLFMGAGVSANSGVPTWKQLLQDVARVAGYSPAEVSRMQQLDVRDQAALVERRLGGADELSNAIANLVGGRKPSLAHALLASLDVQEAVTTNYDSLYEEACDARKAGLLVIPAERVRAGHPWLLKLHGSTEQRDGIVLTREDFLTVGTRRGALLGILQAVLLTRSILFVGYSLSDEDFHSVMSDVRRVIGDDTEVGAAITLVDDPLFAEMWSPHLSVFAMASNPAGDTAVSIPAAARRLQIFLDLVGAYAADMSSFLLAPGYDADGVLDYDEEQLRRSLLRLAEEIPTGDVPGLTRVRELLSDFGYPDSR